MRTEIDLALRRERSADELRDAPRATRDEVTRLAGLATALLDHQAMRHLGFAHAPGDLAAVAREAASAVGAATLLRDVGHRLATVFPRTLGRLLPKSVVAPLPDTVA